MKTQWRFHVGGNPMRYESTYRLRTDAQEACAGTEEAWAGRLTAAKRGGKKSAALRREHAEMLDGFGSCVMQRLGDPDPIERALVESAIALYSQVLKQSRITSAPTKRANPLGLSACVTSLRAILKELGITVGHANDQPEPAMQTVEDLRREYAQRIAQAEEGAHEG